MENNPKFNTQSIDHPSHYGGKENIYEAIKVIQAWSLNFCLGNALKYISRAGKKDPQKHIEDLEKARWYIDYEINRLNRHADTWVPQKNDIPERTSNYYTSGEKRGTQL